MRVRFTSSIASSTFAYGCDQVVTVGRRFSAEEIPEYEAHAWLAGGVLVPVYEGPEAADLAPRPHAVIPRARRR